MARSGLVSSGHHLASLAGAEILRKGGNAYDAAIAVSAVLSVVRPHMTALGGDAFALLYDCDRGTVEALNASGPAPKAASSQLFLDKGFTEIPKHGIYSVSIPGLVNCWERILERRGTMPLSELLKSGIDYARQGFPMYSTLSFAIKEAACELSRCPAAKDVFLPNGHVPQTGEVLIQKDLASTLEALATEGARSFYEGKIAHLIAEYFSESGGLIGEDDLAKYRSSWLTPISTTYRNYAVFEQPPVSQGHILLQELNLVEGYDLAQLGHNSADSIHLMVEAKKLAFYDRLKYLGDPDFVDVPLRTLLSKEYAVKRREQIDINKASLTLRGHSLGNLGSDTTYFAVVDKSGNAVSFIQSLFHSFGSGEVVPGTGIIMNDRMCGFSLAKDHPNRLQPGKRTAHTLNSYILTKNENLWMLGGTPGADDQVQVNLQVIANVIDYQMNVQQAIEAPRWSSKPGTAPGEENDPYELSVENRIPENVRHQLAAKGHNVRVAEAWSFGGSQAIVIDQKNGVFIGGADPRRDGYAIGW